MRLKHVLQMAMSPRYVRDLRTFREQARAAGQALPKFSYRPMLKDATAETDFDRHYVYHTAWATRVLARSKPAKHVDVGSSLYFVALASAMLPVEHLDYRPPELRIDGVTARAGDLMQLPFADRSVASLSCMHVVEHVGLGRYGDPVDPAGDAKAVAELQRVLAPGGQLLFVVPVGKPQIVFNAHRIYPFDWAVSRFAELELVEFALITDKKNGGELIVGADPKRVAEQRYGCGCYLFKRPARTL